MFCCLYRSGSSSSGNGWSAASSISSLYCFSRASSTWTVGGAKARPATNSCQAEISIRQTRNHAVLTYQAWVADKLSRQPQEGLFEVVVGFGGDIVVLEILLAVESDGLGLYFTLFDIDFVATKNDGNLFADTDKVA